MNDWKFFDLGKYGMDIHSKVSTNLAFYKEKSGLVEESSNEKETMKENWRAHSVSSRWKEMSQRE